MNITGVQLEALRLIAAGAAFYWPDGRTYVFGTDDSDGIILRRYRAFDIEGLVTAGLLNKGIYTHTGKAKEFLTARDGR